MSKGPMGARVLVVDDSPTIRKLVSAILAHHDYEPSVAPDGPAALAMLRESAVDLILLDFVMPRMNGYQFCIELRADPELRNTPVVLMSAKGDKIRGQFVQQTGAVDAITKPFDARALLAVVESALQKVADGRVPASDASGLDDEPVADLESAPADARQRAPEPVEPLVGQALDEVAQKLAGAIAQHLDVPVRQASPSVPASRTSSSNTPTNFSAAPARASVTPFPSVPSSKPSPGNFAERSSVVPGALSERASAAPGSFPERPSAPGTSADPVSTPATPERVSTPTPPPPRSAISSLTPRASMVGGLGAGSTLPPRPSASIPVRSSSAGVRIADSAELAIAVRKALTPELLDSVGPALRRIGIGTEPLSGETDVVPLAEVLQVLQLQRQTGTCRIYTGRAEITICFRDGLIDLAVGRGAVDEFRLGRYLVEEGLVTREDLDRTLDHRGMTQRKMGEALIRFGLITEADLKRALVRQTSELVYEVLRWPKARFGFSKESIEQREALRLGLPVASIVMEGFRRVDEWRLIEETIQFDQVLMRDQVALDALGTTKLSRQEQLVLDAIDGQRSVREILSNVDVGSFDACKILYQFLQSRLVRQRAA